MAGNENRPDPRRLRYFNGLIMKQEEFILEQDYHVRMRRLHNRYLHDGGIIDGLVIEIGNTPNEVLVTQGFALDRHDDQQFSERIGRELYLTDDCEVDLSSYQPGDEVWIWISYAEQEVGIVPDRGGEDPIYIQETVVIGHSTNEPPNRGREDVVLGIVEIGPGGVVDESAIKDTFMGQSVRERTAFKVERLSGQVLSLTDPKIPEANTPFLDGFQFEGTGDNGIVVSSDRTRFTGVVDVDTRLNVGTDATIAGNTQIDQNLSVTQNATITGDLTTSGDVIAEQDLTVQGVLNSSNASGALELDDDLHVTGTLQLQSSATINEISVDGTLADNSDLAVPTEQAVKTYVDSRIDETIEEQFVASVAAFAKGSPPTGWLECDGRMYLRTEYPRLFSEIGTTFGAGAGDELTFNVPDLRGEFVRGWDNGRGVDSGRGLGSWQRGEFQGHYHNWSARAVAVQQGTNYSVDWVNSTAIGNNQNGENRVGEALTDNMNGTPQTGPETRPRNVALMYCIKF
ncbi:MAG: tail fiber protein [Leptospirales bacterium]|jgi:microcystin-dependent protein/cytoskeletal protein CcmA (bactofilin family)